MEKWTIKKHADGSYEFFDEKGEVRGKYRNADIMAQHFAFSMQERQRLEKLVSEINQTLTIPAAEYVPAIGDVFKLIDKAKPQYEEIPITLKE